MDMTIFDIISIAGGIALFVAPEWTYNFGRKEQDKKPMPKNWPIISRILGVVFVALGVLFIVLNSRK